MSERENKTLRQVRRRLKKEGRTILTVRGLDGHRRRYIVDIHPSRAIGDLDELAKSLGLHDCGFCHSRKNVYEIDRGVFGCLRCYHELNSRVA